MNGPKAIRDASVAADKKLSAFEVDLGMKKEVRPVLVQVFPTNANLHSI